MRVNHNTTGTSRVAQGGAIFSSQGAVYVSNSTFSGNVAGNSGGGIETAGAILNVVNSTFTGNTAGGGLGGGGIGNRSTQTTVYNSTFSGNSAVAGGGGIGNFGGLLTLYSSLVVNNSPDDLNGNPPSGVRNRTGAFSFVGPLGQYGGPTPVLPVGYDPNSGYGQGAGCGNLTYAGSTTPLPYDQRGATRDAMNCSIGAFEPGGVNTTTTLSATSGGVTVPNGGNASTGNPLTLIATVRGVLGNPISGDTVKFFRYGGVVCASQSVSNGTATCVTNALTQGANAFTANYSAGIYTLPSGTPDFSINGVASTSTAITAQTPNPSAPGQSVAFTVTVSSGSGTPTGTVTLTDVTTDPANPTPFASGTLTNGSVTLPYAALPVGARTVRANYGGNPSYAASVSPTVTQTVAKVNTALSLANLPNPSVFGQAITLTATATSGNGTPDGTVTFTDVTDAVNPVTLGGGSVTLDGTGAARISVSTRSVGAHTFQASYSGSTAYNASTAPTVTQSVNQAGTAIGSITAAPNPSVYGQAVTLTASVSAVAPGAGTPTGTVTFVEGQSVLGTAPLNGGVARLSVSVLTVGAHAITASYAGDANFTGSTAAQVTQTVNQAGTSTALTAAPNPSVFGQAVTLTAMVTIPAPGAGTATGTVTFTDVTDATNSVTLGTPATVNMSGVASISVSTLPVGTRKLTATYNGDANFTGGTSAQVMQTVNRASTSTTLTAQTPNPSVAGQAVTLTATVTATSGVGTPTGTVTFTDVTDVVNPVTLGMPATVNMRGVASLSVSTLPVGTRKLTATYTGDTSFTGSTAAQVTQTVNQAGTSTALTAAPNPSAFGQAVTLTATVTSGAGTPTGTVTFTDVTDAMNPVTLGMPATVNMSGIASLSVSTLPVGARKLTATYNGDTNLTGSTSAQGTQTVNQAGTSTTLTAAPNPSIFGQAVTLSATVTVTAPGAGTPTGTVTFTDVTDAMNPVTLGMPVALTMTGKATLSVSTLPVGARQLTATYSGGSGGSFAPGSGTTRVTVNTATLTLSAPTGMGSNNTGSPGAPSLRASTRFTLEAQQGTVPASGVTYTSSDPNVASVDPSTGVVTGISEGMTTITASGPNGATGTLTITVSASTGGGLMAPAPQPMMKPTGTGAAGATVAAQPTRKPDRSSAPASGGTQPQTAEQPTATPMAQPVRR